MTSIPHSLLLLAATLPCLGQSIERKVQDEMGLWGQHPQSAISEKNIFLNANVSASGHWGNDTPNKATDGIIEPDAHWSCEGLPAWHQVDLGLPKTIERIKIWPYWKDGRIYKYIIEGSLDGKNWQMLVDQSANSISGTAEAQSYNFKPSLVRYIRSSFLDNSMGKTSGAHIVEIQGYEKARDNRLRATAYSDSLRLPWTGNVTAAPLPDNKIALSGWRGERVNAQILIQSDQAIRQLQVQGGKLKGVDGSIAIKANFVKFTKANGTPTADIISNKSREMIDNAAGINRSVWVSLDIPTNAKPGLYEGLLRIVAEGIAPQTIPVSLQVQSQTLPKPQDWGIHLDIWQHPDAVARWHGVEMWSDEHFALMKPLMQRLAQAGQKVITATIIDEAWNGQTYDRFGSMVEWIKQPDGSMRWDYSIFDKWVNFMMNEVGIKNQISCYTMLPWSMKLRVYNEATSCYEFIEMKPGDRSFDAIWAPFLEDFSKHIKAKGWEKITGIGIDERPDYMVRAARKVLAKHGPNFKIISAVNAPSKTTDIVDDMSPIIYHTSTLNEQALAKRRAQNKMTTFYVCTVPAHPNNFTASPLMESEWLGIFAALHDFDGFLRWAYNSWNRNPYETTTFGNWPDGDAFLLYPGNLSSLRFEKMRDGYEEFEKLRLIREAAKSNPELKALYDHFISAMQPYFDKKKTGSLDYAAGIKAYREGFKNLETAFK